MKKTGIIFLFLCCLQAHANKVSYDTSYLEVRKPPADKIDEYRNDKEYQYTESLPKDNSILHYIRYYLQKAIKVLLSDKGIMPFVRYLIIALFIAFVVYQLAKQQIHGLFTSNSRAALTEIEELSEDIHTKNLNELIEAEIKKGNLRKAVRLHYIKMLKLLNAKELINWDQNKTNRDYYYDLVGSGLEAKYQQLTWVYENIWYGNFTVGSEYFTTTDQQFNDFYKEIAHNEKN